MLLVAFFVQKVAIKVSVFLITFKSVANQSQDENTEVCSLIINSHKAFNFLEGQFV